jgi:hypothetical protein
MVDDQKKPSAIRRTVDADLVESQPVSAGMGYWVLASPLILFLAWIWIDLFVHYSPIQLYWLDVVLGLGFFVALVILPAGLGAHRLVTAFPKIFQHAGWDVQALEQVDAAEQYTVRYQYHSRHRRPNQWSTLWPRAAQGWVYLEVAAILLGAIVMIPLFFSAAEYGFGR